MPRRNVAELLKIITARGTSSSGKTEGREKRKRREGRKATDDDENNPHTRIE